MCVGYSREKLISKCRKKPKNSYKTQPLPTWVHSFKRNTSILQYCPWLPSHPKSSQEAPEDYFKIPTAVCPAGKHKKKELWGSEWPWDLWGPWANPSQSYWLEESLLPGHGHLPLFCSVALPPPQVLKGENVSLEWMFTAYLKPLKIKIHHNLTGL